MSNPQERTRRVLEYITRLMRENDGMSYDDAWAMAKRLKFQETPLPMDNPQERLRSVQGWIRRLMENNPGMPYDDAWERAKQAPELAGIFAAMSSKPAWDKPPASPFDLSRRAESMSRDFRKLEMKSPDDLPSPAITGHPDYR